MRTAGPGAPHLRLAHSHCDAVDQRMSLQDSGGNALCYGLYELVCLALDDVPNKAGHLGVVDRPLKIVRPPRRPEVDAHLQVYLKSLPKPGLLRKGTAPLACPVRKWMHACAKSTLTPLVAPHGAQKTSYP